MTYTTLNKAQRKKCWEARDQYFQCLDKLNWVDAATDTNPQCAQSKEAFSQECPNSWVSHFSDLRSQAARQKAYEKLMNNPEYRR